MIEKLIDISFSFNLLPANLNTVKFTDSATYNMQTCIANKVSYVPSTSYFNNIGQYSMEKIVGIAINGIPIMSSSND